MKNAATLAIGLMLFTLTGCELAGDIFSAGFYTGLFIVAVIIAVIAFVVFKIKRK